MRGAPLVSLLLGLLVACAGAPAPTRPPQAYPAAGAALRRIPTVAYLHMPDTAGGALPRLLSQTGAFTDVRDLKPAEGVMPYDLAMAFWSDGAAKSRLVAIPDAKVAFTPRGEWTFPPGTVFVKTFELGGRRLETRLLVLGREGVYGVVYKWRPDLSDADLLPPEGLVENVSVRNSAGVSHEQEWLYPGRQDCLVCHNSHTQGALGPKTRQMNGDLRYPDGSTENQLRRWNRLGLLSPSLDDQAIVTFETLARADDVSRSLEDRARSWLDVNCAHCHRPGGTVAQFDARFETPPAEQHLIDGPVLIDQGIDRARVISPHDPWRSLALLRASTNDDIRMPPLARKTVDTRGVALLREWVVSLPGRDVLAPPTIAPADGNFTGPVIVTISSDDPDAEIRYTLDGSAPGPKDARYAEPIRVESSAVLRARVYREGRTRSVISQRTYLIGSS